MFLLLESLDSRFIPKYLVRAIGAVIFVFSAEKKQFRRFRMNTLSISSAHRESFYSVTIFMSDLEFHQDFINHLVRKI